jgi:hypothetical protein
VFGRIARTFTTIVSSNDRHSRRLRGVMAAAPRRDVECCVPGMVRIAQEISDVFRRGLQMSWVSSPTSSAISNANQTREVVIRELKR